MAKRRRSPDGKISQATDESSSTWEDKYADATNTGILTRITPAIDIDVLDPDVADELQKLAEHMIGISPVRIGQAPKRALLYRTDTPFDKLTTPIYISPDGRAHKVEFGRGSRLLSTAFTLSPAPPTHGLAASPDQSSSARPCRRSMPRRRLNFSSRLNAA